MQTICKNCGNNFDGNFCNNCGQTAETNRLDFHYVRKNLQKLLFKYSETGILYTSSQLFTRPGNSIREYLEGKRVRHFEPFALLVTFATLYGILYHYFDINVFSDISGGSEFDKIDFKWINEWIATHFSLATFFVLPFFTLGSYIAFRKQGYNFVEHLVLNTFLANQRLLLRIATFPVLLILNGTGHIHTLGNIYIFIDILLLTWGYCQFFNTLKLAKSLLLTLLSYLIFYLFFLLLIMIILWILQIS